MNVWIGLYEALALRTHLLAQRWWSQIQSYRMVTRCSCRLSTLELSYDAVQHALLSLAAMHDPS